MSVTDKQEVNNFSMFPNESNMYLILSYRVRVFLFPSLFPFAQTRYCNICSCKGLTLISFLHNFTILREKIIYGYFPSKYKLKSFHVIKLNRNSYRMICFLFVGTSCSPPCWVIPGRASRLPWLLRPEESEARHSGQMAPAAAASGRARGALSQPRHGKYPPVMARYS